ncbi:CWF19-like protein 2 homolog isoform X2 [Athalia rosae]|uniref:CWF19-like protein 2 homolog isoform X2 n=1 Tax=Athalia rosae TaxID=37344 RepID=UPI00203433EE|nr:CWF19-like protein 2 homolog isoform X2 [Athalia rosae]
MSWIQFESGKEKDTARRALRESRDKILDKAKTEYHKKRMHAEQAKLRGDDKWMLPSVESKISSDDKTTKQHKKPKKERKSKKKHHSKSSSNSGSSEEEEWVEKEKAENLPVSEPQTPAIRDEWMSLPGLFPCINHNDEKKRRTEEKVDRNGKRSIVQLDTSERELNPYWKNGGTGLPETEDSRNANNKIDVRWLRKSLQRAQEEAAETGKSLEEVAAERWGSLAKLESMIAKGGNKSQKTVDLREQSDGRKECSRNERNIASNRSKQRSRSRSRERHRSDDKDRNTSSRGYRSRSREKYTYHKESDFRQKKLAFKRPSEDDQTSVPSTSKSSSTRSRNWKKPESLKRDVPRDSVKIRSESLPESKVDSDDGLEKIEAEDIIMTETEMNQLGARIVKCEIMGDNNLAIELKTKLEKAREARKNASLKPTIVREETDVILTKTDVKGMTRPVEPRSEYKEPKGGRRKNKKVDTHEDGHRVRYFADDDKFCIKDMFQQEKGRSTNEDDAMFTKIASKNMDMDEMFEDQVRVKEKDTRQDERDRLQAIKQHERMSKSLDKCRWCIDSKQMLKHMIVAMGSKVYMSLPSYGSLTSGHCIIAPIHHVICQTQLDEDVWEELQAFRKALTKMFMDQEEDVVFFETSMVHRKFPHMQLECVPLPKEIGDLAPLYFKNLYRKLCWNVKRNGRRIKNSSISVPKMLENQYQKVYLILPWTLVTKAVLHT